MKKYRTLLFIISLLLLSIFYNYHHIILKKPQSIHKWRQSDCASIALNYYQNGMNFFHPETNNLTSDKGTTGNSCTSEIPLLYYSVAILYKIFGYHDFIYRIFNTLLFFLGLLFLFKLFNYLLDDNFWPIALTVLIFTSPVLVYYGNSYLSNTPALAFSFIGWYYFIKYLFEKKPKWFYLCILVFLFAGGFKITALISFIAITLVFITDLTGISFLNQKQKLFKNKIPYAISISAVFTIIVAWAAYAHFYNLKHDCTYFSTTIFPVWDLTTPEIKDVLKSVREVWIYHYFHSSVLVFLTICFLFILISFRKNNRVLLFCLFVIISELLAFVILQFWTFKDHDYYTIEAYILPVVVLIVSFDTLKRNYLKIFNSWISKTVFLIFLLLNINYANHKNNERYDRPINDYFENKDLYTITPYLRQIGITADDTVISIPDMSHASLYLMNQKGWTEYSDTRFNKDKWIRYNQDSNGIQTSINKGAHYLILNGMQELYTKPYLQRFCTDLKGNYNDVLIFNLRNRTNNFDLTKRTVQQYIYCNAEKLSSDGKSFVNDSNNILFQNGETRTDYFHHNGKYSSCLSEKQPYGMTIKFDNLKNGESFVITVWRKSAGNTGGLVASSEKQNSFYKNDINIIEKDSNGWEKISLEFFVKSEMTNQVLVIYAYNPDKVPVYFDDMDICRFKSVLE